MLLTTGALVGCLAIVVDRFKWGFGSGRRWLTEEGTVMVGF